MKYRIIIRLIHGLIWVLIAYKWADWKNYRKYYPTMLFMGAGSLIYNVVFYKKRLWDLSDDFLAFPFDDILEIFIIFLPTVLLFLTHYPENKRITKQIKYILEWTLIYVLVELLMFHLNTINYYNGWSIYWSAIHDLYQFPLLYIHHKNPILAWILAFIILGNILHFFKVPFIS